MARMSSGLSRARLRRLTDAVNASVDKGEIAGMIALVERRGDTHIDIVGMQDVERNIQMKRDTIFRLASISKPITAAAAMILVEEGKLRLEEPVDRLLPELANRKVLKRMDGPLDDVEPAKRPITVRDCLTFQLGYGWALGPPTPLQKAMVEAGFGMGGAPLAPDEWIKRLGALPLAHHPREGILYHMGAEVLGVLIERASGQSFADFLKERLLEPLGMRDTGFSLSPRQIERLASAYAFNPETRKLTLTEDAGNGRFASPPAFPSGGGGLVATVDDYLAFGRMMIGKGKLGNTRVLSRPSVEAMTRNYLGEKQLRNQGMFPAPFELPRAQGWAPNIWEGRGWGLGMMVITEALGPTYSVGRFGWDGGSGVMWWADPKEEMNMILMIQRGGGPGLLAADFLAFAYQAIED
ncbi:MAG: serine hydrolase domain-containing protein [Alphaproteobacteria bacterium]